MGSGQKPPGLCPAAHMTGPGARFRCRQGLLPSQGCSNCRPHGPLLPENSRVPGSGSLLGSTKQRHVNPGCGFLMHQPTSSFSRTSQKNREAETTLISYRNTLKGPLNRCVHFYPQDFLKYNPALAPCDSKGSEGTPATKNNPVTLQTKPLHSPIIYSPIYE